MDEHNLRVFVMCTLSVAGALPLGIIITSDEKTETLVAAFSMFKQTLPVGAFYQRGPEVGPEIIMTDNCSELRDALQIIWPSVKLILCIFHILQQVWRWLQDKNHAINMADRPGLLGSFKKMVYSEELEELESHYDSLVNSEFGEKYSNYITYVDSVYEVRESWALPYRTNMRTRGSHTNNSAESQFLIFKDILLQRIKEYNVNALFDKLSQDLSEYYQNKLLSIASGSFDVFSSNRFKGIEKKKSEHVGFHPPSENESCTMERGIVDCSGSIFLVPSATKEGVSYLVDMTIGVCECHVGKCGSPCKHQYTLWVTRKSNCPNFLPVFDPKEREKFARIALGESCEGSMYEGLHDRVIVTPAIPEEMSIDINVESVQNQQCVDVNAVTEPKATTEVICTNNEETLLLTEAALRQAFAKLITSAESREKSYIQGLLKFSKKVEVMSIGQLTSALHNFGSYSFSRKNLHGYKTSTSVRRSQKHKIPVQPEAVKRRKMSSSKGKQVLKKGGNQAKSISNIVPVKTLSSKKREHKFSLNVKENKAVPKKAGRTMLSQTKTYNVIEKDVMFPVVKMDK